MAPQDEECEAYQVTQGREEAQCGTLAISDDEPLLAAALDVEVLNDWASAMDGRYHDLLIDVFGVLGCFLQEAFVSDIVQRGLFRRWLGVGEFALVDEVASQLLAGSTWELAGGSESLQPIAPVRRGGDVEILVVNALLVPRPRDG